MTDFPHIDESDGALRFRSKKSFLAWVRTIKRSPDQLTRSVVLSLGSMTMSVVATIADSHESVPREIVRLPAASLLKEFEAAWDQVREGSITVFLLDRDGKSSTLVACYAGILAKIPVGWSEKNISCFEEITYEEAAELLDSKRSFCQLLYRVEMYGIAFAPVDATRKTS